MNFTCVKVLGEKFKNAGILKVLFSSIQVSVIQILWGVEVSVFLHVLYTVEWLLSSCGCCCISPGNIFNFGPNI